MEANRTLRRKRARQARDLEFKCEPQQLMGLIREGWRCSVEALIVQLVMKEIGEAED